MKAFTDYPFVELGDTPGQAAPWRECVVTGYDHDKYCTINIGDQSLSVKSGYIHKKPDGAVMTHAQLVKAFRLSSIFLSELHGKMTNVVLQNGQTIFGKFRYQNGECFVATYEAVKIQSSDIKDVFIQKWVSILPKSPFEQLKATFDALGVNYLVEILDDENGHWDELYIVSEDEKKAGKRNTNFLSDHQLFEFLNGEVASY